MANVATLPGIVGPSLAMPDIHWGYGFAIGGVAAFDLEEGIVSPGGVGYDINCGVRLLRTRLSREHVAPRMKTLVDTLFTNIPSGVGSRRQDFKLTGSAFKKVLKDGARWAVKEGFGEAVRPGPHRGRGRHRRRRPRGGVGLRPEPRQGPVGHPGFGQPLRRSRLYRRDLRCGPGGASWGCSRIR